MAILNTNLAASTAGLTWMLLDYRLEHKWSAVGFCTGAICGLVAITPAAGYVGAPAAVLIAVLASFLANLLTTLKGYFSFDDAMDIYACHGVAGIVGLVFTGVFCQASVAFNDGYTIIPGGWIDGNFVQVGYQLAWCCACWGWTFVVSYALLFIIDKIPYCNFRASDEAEVVGMDEADLGEFAYDYAQVRRNVHHTLDGDDIVYSGTTSRFRKSEVELSEKTVVDVEAQRTEATSTEVRPSSGADLPLGSPIQQRLDS